jgi:hypothetical protein
MSRLIAEFGREGLHSCECIPWPLASAVMRGTFVAWHAQWS